VKRKTLEVLSVEELEELKGLEADLRGLRKRWRRLVVRLEQARSSSVRAEVGDRLLCVLHDCLSPAWRDLEAIAQLSRRRADADRAVTRRSG